MVSVLTVLAVILIPYFACLIYSLSWWRYSVGLSYTKCINFFLYSQQTSSWFCWSFLLFSSCPFYYSICQQIFKIQQWPQDWKRSVFIPVPKKGKAKECSNYCTIVISHASKVTLKILQVRLQQYMNRELSDIQAGF